MSENTNSSTADIQLTVCAVLPAGGSGERVGLPTPKQFCEVDGRLLISYSLEAFNKIPWIKHIIVPVAAEQLAIISEVVKKHELHKVKTVIGGKTRHRSIYNGIKHIEKVGNVKPDVVVLHDAVRPFITEDILKSVCEAANVHGAAGVVRPLVSTVIKVDEDGFLSESLDRSKYRASEMPQAFSYTVIKDSYEQCTENDFQFGTECLHLAQKYARCRVKLVEGSSDLWKVTHRRDLFSVEGMTKVNQNKVALSGVPDDEFESAIVDRLTDQGYQVEWCHSLADSLHEYHHLVMYCMGTINFELIRKQTDRVMSIHPGLRTLTYVLNSKLKERNSDVRTTIQKCASQAKTNVYLIINEANTGHRDAAELTGGLIWDCNRLLHGQMFYC